MSDTAVLTLPTPETVLTVSLPQPANDFAQTADMIIASAFPEQETADVTPLFVDATGELIEKAPPQQAVLRVNKVEECLQNGDDIARLPVRPYVRKSGKRRRDGIRFRLRREGFHWRRHRYLSNVWRAATKKGRKRVPE